MPLPFDKKRAIADLAGAFYDFLPGSGNRNWRGHVTFASVADGIGVGELWAGGSKQPAIQGLLEGALMCRPNRFEALITGIVSAGIDYRKRKGNPITDEEMSSINGLLLQLGFRFPEMWNYSMKDPIGVARAREIVAREADAKATVRARRRQELARLQSDFLALHGEPNRQKAGLTLEGLLNELFHLFELSPRSPFRVVGEQIDGSFALDNEVYLVEAKWHEKSRPLADLLVFRGKIEGKSTSTRGVFISMSGVTSEAEIGITQGKQPNFFVMDGYDLTMILREAIELDEFLRRRQRILAEEGKVCWRLRPGD